MTDDLSLHERARLQAVDRYRILDTSPEQSFDDITALAAMLLRAPISLISLIDKDRQWFKSRVGLNVEETPRKVSFCSHTIQDEGLLIVEDARKDPRFSDNALVTGIPHIGFYAGIPIRSDDGYALGTLCVIDRNPRSLSAQEQAVLTRLGRLVEELLALRIAKLESDARQQRLESQKAFTEGLLGSLVEAVVACNAEGQLTMFNATARRWHGQEVSDVAAERWAAHYSLYQPDGVTLLKAERIPLMRALRGEALREEEVCIATPGQPPRHVLCNGGPLLDAEGNSIGAVVVMHDNSERKRIEQMKRNFLAVISHELRTPLTSVSGAIDLLLGGAGGALPETAASMLAMAQTNAARLNMLINDLLDIEKLQSGHMRMALTRQPLQPLLQQAVDANQTYAAGYAVQLLLDLPPADLHVTVDANRLLQVMDNYLSNAAKFSPPGSDVKVGWAIANGQVQVSVTDTGAGIAEEHHDSLFKVFSQVDNSSIRQHGGTGLGLSIAKQLVERMEGSVGFTSRLGVGSTFWFCLPLAGEDE